MSSVDQKGDKVSLLNPGDESDAINAPRLHVNYLGESGKNRQGSSENKSSVMNDASRILKTHPEMSIYSPDSENEHENELKDSTQQVKFKERQAKRLATAIKKSTGKELAAVAKRIKHEDLDYVVKNDLTRFGVQSLSSEVPIGTLIEYIKSKFDPCSLPLTAGEKKKMKSSIKSGSNIDDLCKNCPFRSRDDIVAKIKEYEFIATRRTKFKNAQEKLVYEAKWLLMEDTGSQRSRRRAYKADIDEIERAASNIQIQKKVPHVLSEEEKEKRRQKMIQRAEALKEQKHQKALDLQRRKEQQRILAPLRSKRSSKTMTERLQEAAEYFQSIAGDRRPIEGSGKRRRMQAVHFSPFEDKNDRRKNKRIKQQKTEVKRTSMQKSLVDQNKKDIKKNRKKRVGKVSQMKTKLSKTNAKKSSNDSPSRKETIAEEDEKSEDFNPYDPPDILQDSVVSLHDRHFYVDQIYQEIPQIPQLNFQDESNDELLLDDGDIFPQSNGLAKSIIAKYYKRYRDMPISFPPLRIVSASTGDRILNPDNVVNIRFLLYPQHYEQYTLAVPKSNELDPVFEIKKLFEMHYSLYFSHSLKLKKLIVSDYCEKLVSSVEENNFSDFMFVIDKWNKLMTELSPNKVAIGEVDLNHSVRKYLIHDPERKPDLEDLRLDIFFEEIQCFNKDYGDVIEPPSPSYDVIERKSNTIMTPAMTPPLSSNEDEKESSTTITKKHSKLEEPKNLISSKINPCFQKPKDYCYNFYKHLTLNQTMSRFTMQQIFLRVYSRVVSTDSRKLRSYKAFTAEVYGELLPSFTSEVLNKVGLRSSHSFYDLGSGVGNTTFQAALEFGARKSGGCELMEHASNLTRLQECLLQKSLALFGIKELNLDFALHQSFVNNDKVKNDLIACDIIIVNNYLFDAALNAAVGKLLMGVRPGTKIISLRNFISPRYKFSGDNTVFDYLSVEKHDMEHNFSVSWTGNKVPYYISTVQDKICPEYL